MADIEISVNGEAYRVPEGSSVAALLGSLGLLREGVAVAVDTQVIPRSQHDRRVLRPGERVEVIVAVGGG